MGVAVFLVGATAFWDMPTFQRKLSIRVALLCPYVFASALHPL